MNRILSLALFVVLPLGNSTNRCSAEQWNVLDARVDDTAVDDLLRTYLLEQLQPYFDARKADIQSVDSQEKFRERQNEIRKRLLRICGPFPPKSPLNARVVGIIDRDDYLIEKVIYESRPGHHVTANFYRPKVTDGPVPGVLVPCGHSANGKASTIYQSICISLVQQGIAALIYDPIGQGERHQLIKEDHTPIVWGTTEHTLIGIGGLLVGTGMQNYMIWDGMRSLDYLAHREEVDAKRIGCTGNSGGGMMTAYLMALDSRIFAAAPSCYLTTFERLFHTIGPQDAEQNFPGQVAEGLDHADFIHLHAPKPTLMCVATRDFFDNDGAWTTFREVKQTYSMLGISERMGIIDYNDEHGFSKPRRVAAMRFMKRWLLGSDDNPPEGDLTLSTDEELQCTVTGEVLRDFPDELSCFEISRRRETAFATARATLWQGSSEKGLKTARRMSGFRNTTAVPSNTLVATITIDDSSLGWQGEVKKMILKQTGEVAIPALLLRSDDQEKRGPAVVFVSGNGKTDALDPVGECAELVRQGNTVLAIDVRGVGETRDAGRWSSPYFGSDFKPAFLSFHLGRPLVGQRAEDIQSAFNYLASLDYVDPKSIHVVGAGNCGPAALHFAALDRRVASLTLHRSVDSWLDVLAEPFGVHQISNVVPSALEYYDLTDLADSIQPRAFSNVSPVDAAGRPRLSP